MKIVFLSYSYWPPDFGGELLNSIERFESLANRGHKILVLTSGKPGHPKHETNNGVEIKRSPVIGTRRISRGLRRIAFVMWASAVLLQTEVDRAHYGTIPGINKLTSAFVGIWFAMIFRIKGVKTVFVHSLALSNEDSFKFSGISGDFKRKFIGLSDVIVSVSPRLQSDSVKNFSMSKTTFIPYGIHDNIFVSLAKMEQVKIRQSLALSPDDVIFTFLGSIGYRKGFDLIAEAFDELSSQYPAWKLLVIGPRNRQESQNILESEVEAVTRKVRGNSNVVFMGRIDDRHKLAKLLGASDVFIFPTRREGLPIAPMEAMATGVPPIIARIPGITDQVNIHEETGLYIAVDNVDELKAAMIRLGTDEDLRKEYGRAARQRIVEKFSWEKYIDEWEKVYSQA